MKKYHRTFSTIINTLIEAGFTPSGILRLEEYYPNAAIDTYQGVSAFIYSVSSIADVKKLDEIPFAYIADRPVDVENCEYVPDAYEAIMQAVEEKKIILEKYEEITPNKKKWIEKTMLQESANSQITDDYKHFLAGKFGLYGGK